MIMWGHEIVYLYERGTREEYLCGVVILLAKIISKMSILIDQFAKREK